MNRKRRCKLKQKLIKCSALPAIALVVVAVCGARNLRASELGAPSVSEPVAVQDEVESVMIKIIGMSESVPETETEPAIALDEEEYGLLLQLVAAEAEDQEFKAQYMVACVVMNRVESEYFPDTVEDVIWQTEPVEQFTSMWNGRFERSEIRESCYDALDFLIEHGNELPEDVLYFTSDGYLPETIPYMQVDQMYFSRQPPIDDE